MPSVTIPTEIAIATFLAGLVGWVAIGFATAVVPLIGGGGGGNWV